MNWGTYSYTDAGPDNKYWWKVNLGQIYCVQHVYEYLNNGHHQRLFTCTESGCACSSGSCNDALFAIVGIEGDTFVPSLSDCKHGNYVKLESISVFNMYEVAVTKKPGDSSNRKYIFHWIFRIPVKKLSVIENCMKLNKI